MLEAETLDCIVQFDIDAQVIGIQLELIARVERSVFIDVHRKRSYRAVKAELPMAIAGGSSSKIDHTELSFSSDPDAL
jgi:hypothetical protein